MDIKVEVIYTREAEGMILYGDYILFNDAKLNIKTLKLEERDDSLIIGANYDKWVNKIKSDHLHDWRNSYYPINGELVPYKRNATVTRYNDSLLLGDKWYSSITKEVMVVDKTFVYQDDKIRVNLDDGKLFINDEIVTEWVDKIVGICGEFIYYTLYNDNKKVFYWSVDDEGILDTKYKHVSCEFISNGDILHCISNEYIETFKGSSLVYKNVATNVLNYRYSVNNGYIIFSEVIYDPEGFKVYNCGNALSIDVYEVEGLINIAIAYTNPDKLVIISVDKERVMYNKIVHTSIVKSNHIMNGQSITTTDCTIQTDNLERFEDDTNSIVKDIYFMYKGSPFITINHNRNTNINNKIIYLEDGNTVLYDDGIRTTNTWYSFLDETTTTVNEDFIYKNKDIIVEGYSEGYTINGVPTKCDEVIAVADNTIYYETRGFIYYEVYEGEKGRMELKTPSGYTYEEDEQDGDFYICGKNVIYEDYRNVYVIHKGKQRMAFKKESFLVSLSTSYFIINDSLYDNDCKHVMSNPILKYCTSLSTFDEDDELHAVFTIDKDDVFTVVISTIYRYEEKTKDDDDDYYHSYDNRDDYGEEYDHDREEDYDHDREEDYDHDREEDYDSDYDREEDDEELDEDVRAREWMRMSRLSRLYEEI